VPRTEPPLKDDHLAAGSAGAGFTEHMVLPGGSDVPSLPLAIAPDDLRQLADHDATHRTFPGCAGPLAALDTGGEAPRGTVLLVAGYTGSKEDFAPLLAPLSEAGYRVVALDQRGQYESPGPDDPAAYSVEELGLDVLAVARVLREESGEPLHLLGHSFGGLVTRAAVLAEPTLFTSFTLLGSGPSRLTGRRADLLDHLGPLLDSGGVQLVHETLEQVAMTDPRAQAVPAPTREFYARRFLRNSEAGLRGMADAMLHEPDRVPLLVAHGEADDAWLPHVQADMAQSLRARHEVINNSIHSPAVENPARTVAVLLDFWAAASATS
jgi:pimeloyl-ACP methyl ester carboxylesterase